MYCVTINLLMAEQVLGKNSNLAREEAMFF